MELVLKPNATAAVWEHFGFKPNDRGEPINLCEPVCHICSKTILTRVTRRPLLPGHVLFLRPKKNVRADFRNRPGFCLQTCNIGISVTPPPDL